MPLTEPPPGRARQILDETKAKVDELKELVAGNPLIQAELALLQLSLGRLELLILGSPSED
jgi:hypothetical protein